MKFRYLLLTATLLSISVFSCDKNTLADNETTSCGCLGQSSINDIPWIKDLISDKYKFPNGTILMVYRPAQFFCCTYNNESVFYLINPASSLGIGNKVVFNCQGTVLFSGFDSLWQDFLNKKKNEQLLWSK